MRAQHFPSEPVAIVDRGKDGYTAELANGSSVPIGWAQYAGLRHSGVPQQPDDKRGAYYVSAISHTDRVALVLGPFIDDHAAALERVDEVRRYCTRAYSDTAFARFGTCRLDLAPTLPTGKLNDRFGVSPVAA